MWKSKRTEQVRKHEGHDGPKLLTWVSLLKMISAKYGFSMLKKILHANIKVLSYLIYENRKNVCICSGKMILGVYMNNVGRGSEDINTQ